MALSAPFRIKDGIFPKGRSAEGSDIRQRMESFYQDVNSQNEMFWEQAYTDIRFHSGDSTVFDEVYGSKPFTSKQFTFNRIRKVVNMVSGYQRQHRKSLIVTPIDNGDQETADQFTKVLLWMVRNDSILETISDSFHGALTSGINLLQLWMDYASDPISGDLRISNKSYNSFLLDPFFKNRDLSDCNSIWTRSYLTENQIKTLMPRLADDDLLENVSSSGGNALSYPDKFNFLPEKLTHDLRTDRYNKLLAYDEFYYRDTRKQKMLIDQETGETLEWSGRDNDEGEEALKKFLNAYPEVRVINSDIQTIKMAVVVDGEVIYDGENPLGTDTYPFIPTMAYFNPEMENYYDRVQSMVRDLRDPQYLYNRRKNIELSMLESQINTGWKHKENALVDPDSVFRQGEGRNVVIKQGSMMADAEKIQPGQIPPTTLALSESLSAEIPQISGVNEELLGSAEDDKAGILSMLRQGAGLTTLQGLFDNLDLTMKLVGRAAISVIQSNFAPGKIKRIIEEEPSPQFYNKAFGKYDAAIEEGVNTSTQKQMQLQQLLHVREIGIPVPDRVIIEALTIQNKTELVEAIEQDKQEVQQEQQRVQEIEMQLQQAQAELARARAFADQGLGDERYSRIPENRALAVERIAEANKDDEQALLNKMKAISELEQMDINQLDALVSIANALKASEQVSKQGLAAQASGDTSTNTGVK